MENSTPGRKPRLDERRSAARRLTAWAMAGAVALNALLFLQASIQSLGVGAVQDQVISGLGSLFQRGGIAPGGVNPSPGVTPIAVTGGS